MLYATLEDVEALFRTLSESEKTKAAALIRVVSAELRVKADSVGKDLDALAAGDENFAELVKSVTVDVVARALNTPTTGAPMTQISQSALGYSTSGTYLVPGGGVFIKKTELARLGLRRQRGGFVDFV